MYREQDISFVYEHGVLRPEGTVDWPEGARGVAHIRQVAAPGQRNNTARREAIRSIRQIGESGVFNSGGHTLTRDQMHERG